MATSLPQDYKERVYAGVLGKVIGVYLGRPFEGWTYDRIQEKLGDIEYYVHDKLNMPLIVTDDDISGTFTFLRAMADNNHDKDLTANQIGQAWLNYLIEERTILWWGGLGNSTEHTAYLRLKEGIPAPQSGSMELNGKVVSEQIGAQIFIDGWAMVSPGDPDQAARLAEQAARVSHDGEAVYGALVLAVMESMAFVENDTNKLIDLAYNYIPADSVIRRLIDDVRGWHAKESDWRVTREWLAENYGYDKYGGNCHMVPNHGLIMHALLHGEDDFSETMKIINTCGWDTDCNSGNLGCLMGIKEGLAGIDASLDKGVDWRGPVADRIYIPTADPTWGITDCANEAIMITNTGLAMAGETAWQPKSGAQFHFELPGAVQGFMVTEGIGNIENVAGHSVDGERTLRCEAKGTACFGSPVFSPSKEISKLFEKYAYALIASPKIHPGQTLKARLIGASESAQVCLYLKFYGEADEPTTVRSDVVTISSGEPTDISFQVPAQAHPIFEVGVEVIDNGVVHIDTLRWDGVPDITLTRPAHKGTMWRRAWANAVDTLGFWGEPYRLIQNQGRGLLIQGSREWQDYQVSADVTPHLAKSAGIAARVQGMRRYYALVLHRDQELRLIKMHNEDTILASCPFKWTLGETFDLNLSVQGNQITAAANGKTMLSAEDDTFAGGGAALLIEEGRTATQAVTIKPN
ncbi:MAG: ADP-ribosylglycohydrolase family protein [Pseudomonadota bacterium]